MQTEKESFSKSTKTKKCLEDALIRLLGQKKLDRISVSELVSEAGFSRGTFYQYYEDIIDLKESIQKRLEAESEKCLSFQTIKENVDNFEQLSDILGRWYCFCRDNSEYILTLLGPNGDGQFERNIKKQWKNYISGLMMLDRIPDSPMREYFVDYISESSILLIRLWLASEKHREVSPEELTMIMSALRVDGLSRVKSTAFSEIKTTTDDVAGNVLLGTAILSKKKFEKSVEVGGETFYKNTFTPSEIVAAEHSHLPIYTYMQMYAIKGAVIDAVMNGRYHRYNEIEVHYSETEEKFDVTLYKNFNSLAREKGVYGLKVSVSYETDYVSATAIALKKPTVLY